MSMMKNFSFLWSRRVLFCMNFMKPIILQKEHFILHWPHYAYSTNFEFMRAMWSELIKLSGSVGQDSIYFWLSTEAAEEKPLVMSWAL